MDTPPFTPAFEANLKLDIQGGTMTTLRGRIVDPQFVCCVTGTVVGVDKDPVARLFVAPTEACVGDDITANPCNSYHPQDPAFVITDYQIEWGDGAGTGWLAFGGCVAHNYAYAAPGVYTITLTVRDDHGPILFGRATVQVLIVECPGDGGDWEEGAYAAGLYVGCGASGVWFSEDGGLNWFRRGLDGVLIRDLKVNPFSLSSVYLDFDAITGDPFVVNADVIELWAATENGLYKSINGGLSWSFVFLPAAPELVAIGSLRFHVRAVKPSTVDPLEIYLAVDAVAAGESFVWVYRTTDGGATWTTLRVGPAGWEAMAAGLNGRPHNIFIDTDGTPLVGCETCFIATGCEAANRAIQFTAGAWDDFGVGIDVDVFDYLRTPAGVLWACGAMDDTCGVRATGVIRQVAGAWQDVPGHGFAHADSFSQLAFGIWWDPVRNRLWAVGDSDTLWAHVEYYDGVAWTTIVGGGIGNVAGNTSGVLAVVTDAQGNAYVGGDFEFANGGALTVNDIAYYDFVTGWETLGTDDIGASGTVRALALDADGQWLYIGGSFITFGGITVNRFCRYNTATGDIEALGTNFNASVYSITILPDGRIFVGGAFVTDGDGNAALRVAIYDPIAHQWSPLGTGMNNLVRSTDYDPDTNTFYAAGNFTEADGNVVNYVSRYVTGQATLPAEGRTHIIDMDINGQDVYLGLLDTSGNPFIAQIAFNLGGFKIIYEPGTGTWGGVLADLHFPNRVWLFGDFGDPKLLRYVVNSGQVIDTTDAFWTGTDMIRPLLQSPILMRDLVAIENIAAGVARAWRSFNTGTDWLDLGVVDDDGGAFLAQCGARDFIGPNNVFVGASTVPAASHHVRWSPNTGYDFLERSSGILPTTAPITSIIVVA